MPNDRKKWGIWIATFVATILFLASGVLTVQVVMDPFWVWNSDLIWGVNNWKYAQWTNDRLFKAYQVQTVDPEVIIFGTSRTNIAYPGFWPGKPAEAVYNYGQSGVHIPELAMQVDFVLDTKRPKTLVFAMEPLMFSDLEIAPKPGFSKERLDLIRFSPVTHLASKLRETVFNWGAIAYSKNAVRGSRIMPNDIFFDKQGWTRYTGLQRHVTKDKYMLNTWIYLTFIYQNLTLSKSSLQGFARIIEKVKSRGIRPVVLLNPLSTDYLLCLAANRKLPLLDELKRELVKFVPVWDFAYVNSVTRTRDNYVDGAHHNSFVGRLVLSRVAGVSKGVPEDFGVLLTPDNVELHLGVQQMRLTHLKRTDAALLNAMIAGLKHRRKPLFVNAVSKVIPFKYMGKTLPN